MEASTFVRTAFARPLQSRRDYASVLITLISRRANVILYRVAMGSEPTGRVTFVHNQGRPALAALTVARHLGVPIEVRGDPKLQPGSEEARTGDGATFTGEDLAVRLFARLAQGPNRVSGAYGEGPVEATEVDVWINYALSQGRLGPGKGLEEQLEAVGEYLRHRTYLVGRQLTLADMVVWGALRKNKQAEVLRGKDEGWQGEKRHVWRWMELVESYEGPKRAAEECLGAGKRKASNEKREVGGEQATGSFEVNLPGAVEGAVVTRFPPEPSGYLHIGHAKAALLNDYFARKYKGTLILRFDDTNPEREESSYEEAIMEDARAMGLCWSRVTHTSDHFQDMISVASRMVSEGKIFIDDTSVDEMRHQRLNCLPSKRRDRPIEENERLWKEMVQGTEDGKACCARLRMDYRHANGCLRDPVAFRCSDSPHPRTGSMFKAYPTYDFACPYADAVEGVTHALRTSEYKDRDEQYQWVQQLMGVRTVHLWDYSRLNFVHTTLSKRKLQWFVESGLVEGWDDPRFPTVRGIMRRGLTVEALRWFIISQGASRNVNLMEWDKVWALNKQVIDPVCPRHTALLAEGRVPVEVRGFGQRTSPEILPLLRHKKHPPAGKKAGIRSCRVFIDQDDARNLALDEEFTLMDWGNAIVREKNESDAGNVASMSVDLHLEGDYKRTKWKVHWLPDDPCVVNLQLAYFGPLLAKKVLEDGDSLESAANKDSRHEVAAVGDANMRNLRHGEIIQLERKGYFRVDRHLIRDSQPLLLINIPDGKKHS